MTRRWAEKAEGQYGDHVLKSPYQSPNRLARDGKQKAATTRR
jgi:hypothetical protein